jgi:hypothetical protein
MGWMCLIAIPPRKNSLSRDIPFKHAHRFLQERDAGAGRQISIGRPDDNDFFRQSLDGRYVGRTNPRFNLNVYVFKPHSSRRLI